MCLSVLGLGGKKVNVLKSLNTLFILFRLKFCFLCSFSL